MASHITNQESSITDYFVIKTFFNTSNCFDTELTVENYGFPFHVFCYPKSNYSNSWTEY